VPLVVTAYLFLWPKLPPELIVHWTFKGTPDTGFLMGRGLTLLIGLSGQVAINRLFTWKLRKATAEKRLGILLRYYVATIVLTICCVGTALYNVCHK